jgi:hypothetical protein
MVSIFIIAKKQFYSEWFEKVNLGGATFFEQEEQIELQVQIEIVAKNSRTMKGATQQR